MSSHIKKKKNKIHQIDINLTHTSFDHQKNP